MGNPESNNLTQIASIIYSAFLKYNDKFIIDICIDGIVVLESAKIKHTIKCLKTFNLILYISES